MQMGATNGMYAYPQHQQVVPMNYLPYAGAVNAPLAPLRVPINMQQQDLLYMPSSMGYYPSPPSPPPQYTMVPISGEYLAGTEELTMSMAMPFDATSQLVNDFSQLDLLPTNDSLNGDLVNGGTMSERSGSDLSQSNSDAEPPSLMTLQMNSNAESSRPPEGIDPSPKSFSCSVDVLLESIMM